MFQLSSPTMKLGEQVLAVLKECGRSETQTFYTVKKT